MSKKLQTSIVIDLQGNLLSQAKKYGRAFNGIGARAKKSFLRMQRSAAMASNGLDRIGNRYTAADTPFLSAHLIKSVADFDKQISRLGTNANMPSEQVEELKQLLQDVATDSNINISRDELGEALDTFIGRTGDIEAAQDNIHNLALAIQGFGADAKASGELMAAMWENGIRNAEQVQNQLDRFFAQFSKGSISVKEFANEAPRVFAQLTQGGPEAMTQMGALFQIFAKTKGSASEVSTSIEALFRTFTDAKKQADLQAKGIRIFEDDGQTMRDQFAILEDVQSATSHLGGKQLTALSENGLFDATALSGLRALLAPENRKLMQDMISGNVEYGMTAKAAARNAGSLGAVLTGIKGTIDQMAHENFSGPLQEFSEWLNSLDKDTVSSTVNFVVYATAVVKGAVAIAKALKGLKKGYDIGRGAYDWVRYGKQGKKGPGNVPGAGAVQKVFVVNMAMGGTGGGVDRKGGRRGKGLPQRNTPRSNAKTNILSSAPSKAPGRFTNIPGLPHVTKAARGVPIAGTAVSGLMIIDAVSNGTAEDVGRTAGALGGGAGGAAAGALIGSIVPGLGTAIGGLIGGILGSLGGEFVGGKVGEQFIDDSEGKSAPASPRAQRSAQYRAARENSAMPGSEPMGTLEVVFEDKRISARYKPRSSGLNVTVANGPTSSVIGG
ncbi:hypothetical protein F9L16_22740 [Agarivorans sp. B2Z047]|uniref:phage tail tape measure protein n=1 Tax=Agarivorans sp. B2Z047 TaxID=2652721 RepID=UPI00128B23FE|nr:phage tail tape measure protein [Agarivorans sp. B2Z047]MPW31791.1 hypothetical protein [Agarivorans sp. B2Z047]UQN43744.1 hypothetical protein LQZ07_04545 [Agarivorans sp. B2Z047]